MRFIKSILAIIFFFIGCQIFSNSVLYSAEIPYIQYKKPDGTIAKYPLTELKSITFGYLTCYDKCVVVFNDSTKKEHNPQSLEQIYYDSITKKIIFVTIGYGWDGRKHTLNVEYSIDKIAYIKFYEFFENVYNGKRLTKISVSLRGLNRTIIERKIYSTPMHTDESFDTVETQDIVELGIENPLGCYGATITDTSIKHYFSNYYNKGADGEGTTNYSIELKIDTSKKVISTLTLKMTNNNSQTIGSHLQTFSSETNLNILDIPYKLNENGFIEVLNTEIPLSNIIKYTYFKGSGDAYGGGASSDNFTMSKFSTFYGKVFISLEFGWKNK